MSNLSPDTIQQLVAKAFVLEALTDKPGCTTRYEDLPGKPLQDFVIAGINASSTFRLFAVALAKDPNTPVFSFNVAALKASNEHKSAKYINFGLLEILFPTVAARLATDEPDKVVDMIVEVVKATNNNDVRSVLETRDIAWATSVNDHKSGFQSGKYSELDSVWSFYTELKRDSAPETSNVKWIKQFESGLPILRNFFDGYQQSGEIMESTKVIFARERAANPDVAVGIVADMCAAAMFLWLSFNQRSV